MDWSHVDYCDVFISRLDTHSDGTHSLQRIHLVSKWFNAKFLQISSDEETRSSYFLDGLLRVSKFLFMEITTAGDII